MDFLEILFRMDIIIRPCAKCAFAPLGLIRSLAPWSHALCVAYTDDASQERFKEWAHNWDILPAHDVVCRACGCGDNTIGHWTRWCIVPLIVAIDS